MPITQNVREMLARRDGSTRIALVGASNNRSKFGNKILGNMRRKGFTMLPVNPHEAEVEGIPAYPSLAEVPGPVHIVNLVVPPAVSLAVLREADPERFPVVWLQPGSYDEACCATAVERFDTVIVEDCIMVETRRGL